MEGLRLVGGRGIFLLRGCDWSVLRNRCVTRMDHHCPWMANCVGHYNYRYFFNFLFYLWSFALYTVIMAWPYSGGITVEKASEAPRGRQALVKPLHHCRIQFSLRCGDH
eukprot:6425430-Pyramimonas_sp.AAC.1